MRVFRALIVASLSSTAWAQVEVAKWIGAAPGERFGGTIEFVGDLDGDQHAEFAIAAPFANGTGLRSGLVHIYSGRDGTLLRTHSGISTATDFGTSIAAVGDLDGDGVVELLIGAGGMLSSDYNVQVPVGYAQLLSGANGALLHTFEPPAGAEAFGRTVLGGVDYNGDGVGELLIGAPGDGYARGYVYVYSGATFEQLRRDGDPRGRSFGYSLEYLDDLNGDGVVDYAAGAPQATWDSLYAPSDKGWVFAIDGATGDVVWFSSGVDESQKGWSLAQLDDLDGDQVRDLAVGWRQGAGTWVACQIGSRVEVLSGADGSLMRVHNPTSLCPKFGTTVCALGDLDGDGLGEYAGAGPGWFAGGDPAEAVRVFHSQPPPVQAALIASPNVFPSGYSFDGWGFAMAAGDVNGDGLSELLIGAPMADDAGSESGAVYAFSIVRDVRTYCESTPNSLGCLPTIGWSGTPSVSNPQPFTINATQVLNQKIGFLFYGFAPQQKPGLGSWRCVVAPTRRTPNLLSGGNPLPSDCSGAFGYDFNARIASGVDPALAVGVECFAQYWMRDPTLPSTVVLSNALAFRVGQ